MDEQTIKLLEAAQTLVFAPATTKGDMALIHARHLTSLRGAWLDWMNSRTERPFVGYSKEESRAYILRDSADFKRRRKEQLLKTLLGERADDPIHLTPEML